MQAMRDTKAYKQKLLSVVIPAYKVEGIIVKTLSRIKGVLDQIRYDYEIICVVDGQVDKTFERALALAEKFPEKIRVVGYKNNKGKGHAVRYGMARAKGEIVAFVDADIDLNPNGLSMLLEHFEWYGADIVVGSKRHPASKVNYPWQRKVTSFGYQVIVRVLFGLKIKDTQVGMKFFKRRVVERVLPRLLVKQYAFDIEMLSVANYLGFKRIFEAPIDLKLTFGKGSTIASVGFLKTSWDMFWDTAAVFYRLKILRYYDEGNKKNWITPKYLTITQK